MLIFKSDFFSERTKQRYRWRWRRLNELTSSQTNWRINVHVGDARDVGNIRWQTAIELLSPPIPSWGYFFLWFLTSFVVHSIQFQNYRSYNRMYTSMTTDEVNWHWARWKSIFRIIILCVGLFFLLSFRIFRFHCARTHIQTVRESSILFFGRNSIEKQKSRACVRFFSVSIKMRLFLCRLCCCTTPKLLGIQSAVQSVHCVAATAKSKNAAQTNECKFYRRTYKGRHTTRRVAVNCCARSRFDVLPSKKQRQQTQ